MLNISLPYPIEVAERISRAIKNGDSILLLGNLATLSLLDYVGKDIALSRIFVSDTVDHQPDFVLAPRRGIPASDNSADIVIIDEIAQRHENFISLFKDCFRILKNDGVLFSLSTVDPTNGPNPYDPNLIILPNALIALEKELNLAKVDCQVITHEDKTMVFGSMKKNLPFSKTAKVSTLAPEPTELKNEYSARPIEVGDTEAIAGKRHYHAVLKDIHSALQPRGYLEIGIRNGDSLSLANCPAIGVDPAPQVNRTLPSTTSVIPETSDDFFSTTANSVLNKMPLDLAFIDGMHLFEFALRDFINVEKGSNCTSVVIFDDIFPNHSRQAMRDRQTKVWTGDIWKITLCLSEKRPDLLLIPLDTSPSGMLIVAGLDSKNTLLLDQYQEILDQYLSQEWQLPPPEILSRKFSIAPDGELVRSLMTALRDCRDKADSHARVRELIDTHAF